MEDDDNPLESALGNSIVNKHGNKNGGIGGIGNLGLFKLGTLVIICGIGGTIFRHLNVPFYYHVWNFEQYHGRGLLVSWFSFATISKLWRSRVKMGTPATLITKGLTIRRHEHVGLQQRYVFYERSHRVPGTPEKVMYIWSYMMLYVYRYIIYVYRYIIYVYRYIIYVYRYIIYVYTFL